MSILAAARAGRGGGDDPAPRPPALPLFAEVMATAVVVVVRAIEVRGLEPARSWRTAISDGARLALADPIGSVLLLTAVGLCMTIVWMYTLLVILAPGLLTFAIVGVASRRGRTDF